jgi:hypothetical protein
MSGTSSSSGFADAGEPLLDVAHGVVAEIADQPAAEARQLRVLRHPEALDVGMDERERVSVLRFVQHAAAADLGAGDSPHLEDGSPPRAR